MAGCLVEMMTFKLRTSWSVFTKMMDNVILDNFIAARRLFIFSYIEVVCPYNVSLISQQQLSTHCPAHINYSPPGGALQICYLRGTVDQTQLL